MHIIQITMNGISSYYYTEKDHKKIISFANTINNTKDSDVKIGITEVVEDYVPRSIKLDDGNLRFFNLESIYGNKNSKVSDYTTNRIAKECAFNEAYCDFVGSLAVSLTETQCSAYIGKAIVDNILLRAIKIIEDHKEHVYRCFDEYTRSCSFCTNQDHAINEHNAAIDHNTTSAYPAMGIEGPMETDNNSVEIPNN